MNPQMPPPQSTQQRLPARAVELSACCIGPDPIFSGAQTQVRGAKTDVRPGAGSADCDPRRGRRKRAGDPQPREPVPVPNGTVSSMISLEVKPFCLASHGYFEFYVLLPTTSFPISRGPTCTPGMNGAQEHGPLPAHLLLGGGSWRSGGARPTYPSPPGVAHRHGGSSKAPAGSVTLPGARDWDEQNT